MKPQIAGHFYSVIAGVLIVLLLIAGTPLPGAAQAQALHVSRALISLDVIDREPVGEGWRFPVQARRVYCYTAVEGADSPTSITHAWYYEDRKVHTYTLPVEAASWRTWSYKNIAGSQKGDWKVEVLDAQGKVLTTVHFVMD